MLARVCMRAHIYIYICICISEEEPVVYIYIYIFIYLFIGEREREGEESDRERCADLAVYAYAGQKPRRNLQMRTSTYERIHAHAGMCSDAVWEFSKIGAP